MQLNVTTVRGLVACALIALTLPLSAGCESQSKAEPARGDDAAPNGRAAPSEEVKTPAPAQAEPVVRQGYGLMYDLVSRQKDVSRILILKSVSDQTKPIIEDIAQTAADMSQKIEAWAKIDGLDLDREKIGMPRFDMEARDATQARTTKYLLFGSDFEVKLIYTQMNACEYGLVMARHLASLDIPDNRKLALRNFADKYESIFDRLVARLEAK